MANTETLAKPQVRVGVGVFVFNNEGSFIVGKRMGSHGAGTWALPGGHLEFGESFETCAVREVLEETGLSIRDDSVRFLSATNDIMASEHKHYVTIFMGCRPNLDSLEPRVGLNSCTFADGKCNICRASADVQQIMEPEKCERWEWVTWQDMRSWAEVQMRQEDGDPAADESSRGSNAQAETRQLFLPLLSLLRQRSPVDPGQSYEPKP